MFTGSSGLIIYVKEILPAYCGLDWEIWQKSIQEANTLHGPFHSHAGLFQTKWGFTILRAAICYGCHGYSVIQIHRQFTALEYDMIGSHTLC